jgi:hypothetical protein
MQTGQIVGSPQKQNNITRPRRLLFICLLAAVMGILLAFIDRSVRAKGKPGAVSLFGWSEAAASADQNSEPRTPRQETYVKIVTALDGVEESAVRKFGRKPRPDDKAGFTIPYKVFVDEQTQRARKQLVADLGLSESAIDEIKEEGDRSGWPRR